MEGYNGVTLVSQQQTMTIEVESCKHVNNFQMNKSRTTSISSRLPVSALLVFVLVVLMSDFLKLLDVESKLIGIS